MNISMIGGANPGLYMRGIGGTERPNPSDFAGKIIESKDSDGDGALSIDEVSQGERTISAERFAEIDSNGDGLLTQDEMSTFMKNMQAKFAKMGPPLGIGSTSSANAQSDLTSLIIDALTKSKGNEAYQNSSLFGLEESNRLSTIA